MITQIGRYSALALALLILPGMTACKKYNIRDVDPGATNRVRSLGPESKDAVEVSDWMVRSIETQKVFQNYPATPVIAVLPMKNNTRYNFNTELFTTLFRVELRKAGQGKFNFVSRDISADVLAEREAKREGKIDYDPATRTNAPSGAEIFLVGSANGLTNTSKLGQSETILYEFRLVDSETGIDLWQDAYMVKREGKDDVIYR